jgi:hypothetical protein
VYVLKNNLPLGEGGGMISDNVILGKNMKGEENKDKDV